MSDLFFQDPALAPTRLTSNTKRRVYIKGLRNPYPPGTKTKPVQIAKSRKAPPKPFRKLPILKSNLRQVFEQIKKSRVKSSKDSDDGKGAKGKDAQAEVKYVVKPKMDAVKQRMVREKERAMKVKEAWEDVEMWVRGKKEMTEEEVRVVIVRYIGFEAPESQLTHLTEKYGVHGGVLNLLTNLQTLMSSLILSYLSQLLSISSSLSFFRTYAMAYTQLFGKAKVLDHAIEKANEQSRMKIEEIVLHDDETQPLNRNTSTSGQSSKIIDSSLPQIQFPKDTSKKAPLRAIFGEYGYVAPQSVVQMTLNLWIEDLHSAIEGNLSQRMGEWMVEHSKQVLEPSKGALEFEVSMEDVMKMHKGTIRSVRSMTSKSKIRKGLWDEDEIGDIDEEKERERDGKEEKGEQESTVAIDSVREFATSLWDIGPKTYKYVFETPFLEEIQKSYRKCLTSSSTVEGDKKLTITAYLSVMEHRLSVEESLLRTSPFLQTFVGARKKVSDFLAALIVTKSIEKIDGFEEEKGGVEEKASSEEKIGVQRLKDATNAWCRDAPEEVKWLTRDLEDAIMAAASAHDVKEDEEKAGGRMKYLLALRVASLNLIKEFFNGDVQLGVTVEKVFQKLVNKKNENQDSSPTFLLANYVDTLLSTVYQSSVEGSRDFDGVLRFFKALEDKDAFLEYHTRFYIRRIIKSQSRSSEEEEKLVDALGTVGETRKLSQLIKDERVSQDLRVKFRRNWKDMDNRFNIHVFSSWTYNLKRCDWKLKLPIQLNDTYSWFNSFYKTKYKSRTLSWQWNVSTLELQTLYTKGKKYILQMSLMQGILLLRFEESNVKFFSRDQLKESTGIEEDEPVDTSLERLVNSRILNFDQGSGLYSINEAVRFKSVRVQVDRVVRPTKTKRSEEQEEVEKGMAKDRSLTIQASIVRSMKKHQIMEYQTLVIETIESLKDRFQPQPKDIKKAVEILLEKEYIERTKVKGRDGYKYLS